MKRSIRLLGSLSIITSLVACADGGETSRSKSSSGAGESPTSDSEVDYKSIDGTFNISSATLNNLKDANKDLERFMASIERRLVIVTARCETADLDRKKLLDALAPIGGELAALVIKHSALAELLQSKQKEQDGKKSALSVMRGNLAAVKTEIANFDGDYKKKLALAIAKLDAEVKKMRIELKAVEKNIDAALDALPFDSAKYTALDVSRDLLNDKIDQLVRERVQLKVTLSATAKADLIALETKRVALQKTVDDQAPGLIKDIEALRAEILVLIKAVKAVNQEISNDKDAQTLTVPKLPDGCVKLLAK